MKLGDGLRRLTRSVRFWLKFGLASGYRSLFGHVRFIGVTDSCGKEIACAWPEPLSLSVVYGEDRVRVQTQLLGEYWVSAVLAALATAIAIGVPLKEAAAAVRSVPPVYGRMSVHRMADGVTFIQGTWKAPLYTIPASLRLMETARAQRKIVIIGMISDSPGSASDKYRELRLFLRDFLASGDIVWIAG